MKRDLHPVLICLALILAVACGPSKEDRAVDDLVREATELAKLADRERGRKVTEAEYLEREALARLERAVTAYPKSQSLARLLSGETRIGPYTYSEFKEKVTAQEEARAQMGSGEGSDAVDNALALAGDLASRPGPLYYQSGLLSRIAAAFSRRGQDPIAEEFFARALISAQSVEAPYYKILAFCELAGRYVLAGRQEEAGRLLLEAGELAGEIGYPFFRSGAAAVVADCYLEIGWDEEALEIIETIEEPYYRARIQIKNAANRIETGKPEEAREWLARVREEAARIEDPVFRVEIITDSAGYWARLEDPAAPELFNVALALASDLDDAAARAGALTRIAAWFGRLDRRREAVDILERSSADAATIEDNLFKDLVLLEIAEALAGMEEYDRVEEIIGRMESPRFKFLGRVAVAESCLAAGQEERAFELAGQVWADSEMVDTPYFRSDILIRVAECLSRRYPAPPLLEEPTPPSGEELPPPSGEELPPPSGEEPVAATAAE